jgi:membrane protease YdiL (CAAX protease family)
MSTVTSVDEISASHSWLPIWSALEVILVYAGIVTYIWRWRSTHPQFWIVLLSLVLASHLLHHDTFRRLGLSLTGMRASAQIILPIGLAFYVPLLVFGFARHALTLMPVNRHAAASLLTYGIWCAFQQYLAQSYFHNRLMEVVRNRHLRSLLVGIIFGSAHIPNPILMVATTVAGVVFAEVFVRHRNIWPIALAQAVGGLLIAAVSPASLIHNMRVGPGYLFYGLR